MKKLRLFLMAFLAVSFFTLASCEDEADVEAEEPLEEEVEEIEIDPAITPAEETLEDTTVIIDENAQ